MTIKQLPFRERPGETPAERTLRRMEFDPELLDETARQLFMSESGNSPGYASRQYTKLTEDGKEKWRKSAISRMKEFVAMSPAEQKFHNRIETGKMLKKNDERFIKLMEKKK